MHGPRRGVDGGADRRRVMRLGSIVAVLALVIAPASAGPLDPQVDVRSNFFDPQELRITAGQTVQWNAVDGGHSVDAEDGRFRFPDSAGTLSAGDTVTYTFTTDDERVVFACRVHSSMRGVVVVGDPPPPPPVEDPPAEIRNVPSPAFPTISSAV